jgi:hypothetical protein
MFYLFISKRHKLQNKCGLKRFKKSFFPPEDAIYHHKCLHDKEQRYGEQVTS